MGVTNRIILGTANFSKEYNGTKVKDVDSIIAYAKAVGIWALDTAVAYDTHHIEYDKKIIKLHKDDIIFGEKPYCIMSHDNDGYERAIGFSNKEECLLGASIYDIDELNALTEYAYKPAMIEFPYSVLDQRAEAFIPVLMANGIATVARSIFLKKKIFTRTDPFKALSFVLMNPMIRRVVIGTESLQMLQDTLEPFLELERMATEDLDIIDTRRF
jgi:aryl-alcohol dehydrogenase-like predicted oxidoreductase